MSEKLYYEDPFLKEFTAAVLSCEQDKDGWMVALDRTAFYPEGGGQPADQGTLGGTVVSDVREKDGVILHRCGRPLPVGETVTGVIDWTRRFDHMQQHSGEHIVSGIICTRYGCDNVGFHLGKDVVTIDFNYQIPSEDLPVIEAAANAYIWEDHPIDIRFLEGAALEQAVYRSKKYIPGQVRLVAFPGADCCACCGTHVLRAGQVGMVKVLSCQKFRDGVRLEIISGRRALAYLGRTYDQAKAIGQQLSVKPQDTAAAVERTVEELTAAKVRMAHLEEQVFFHMAEENTGKGDTVLFQSAMKSDSVRKLADAVAHRCGGLAAVFAGADGDKYNYALVRCDGGDIAPLVKDLNRALNGRGGGRGGFAQGSVQANKAEIEAFFQH